MQYAADINSSLESVLSAAMEMLSADMGNIQVLDPESKRLEIVVTRGFDSSHFSHFQDVARCPGSACSQVLKSVKRVYIPDIRENEAYAKWHVEATRIGYHSVLCVPLLNRHGGILGVMSLQFCKDTPPSDTKLRMLDLYARQAVDAMEAGRIAKAALRSTTFLRFLDEWNEATRDLEDPKEIIDATLRRVAAALTADCCRYEEIIPESERVVILQSWSNGSPAPNSIYPFQELGEQITTSLRSGRAVAINLEEEPSESLRDYLKEIWPGSVSVLLCPVLQGKQLACMLTLHQSSKRIWLSDEISLLQQVADRCWAQIERGRVTQELRASELRNRTFLNTVPTAVWLTDGSGAMIRSNDSWSRYTGQSWDAYSGWGWLDAVHPDDRESVENTWIKSLEKGDSFTSEFRLRRHDGEFRHISCRGAPVTDETGLIREWVGICDDIHQDVLSTSRNRFLIELDEALRSETDPQMMTRIAVRLLGQFLNADRCGWAEMEQDQDHFHVIGDFNVGVHSVVGRHSLLDYGDDFRKTIRSGLPYVINDCHTDPRCEPTRAEFDKLEIRAAIVVPLMKAGRLTGIFGVQQKNPRLWTAEEIDLVQHVTSRCWESIQRAHVSQELRQNEYRLRLAQRAGRIGSFEWLIPEDRFFWSAELQSLFGKPQTPQESTFDDWLKMCVPEDAARIRKQIDSTLSAGGIEVAYEFRTNVPGRMQRWLRGQAIFLYDAAGNPREMIGVNIDIDGQKRAADELRDADRRKDEFLATLAHELRNPLAPIRNAIEILQLGDNDPESVKEMHQAIDRQVQQLIRLVDDLLDVSRITRGKIELRRSKILLNDVLMNAVETSHPAIQAAGQSLVTEFPKQSIWLDADQTRLAQVFANLLNNAAKYSEPGGEIRIRVQSDEKHVTVHVADQGIGIPPEMLSRIFEPFTQVEGSIQRSRGGLGIGLTLVKRLVELHGGRVSVVCTQGTTFSVQLPVCDSPGPQLIGNSSPPIALPRRRILVVDDTPMALYMVERLLEKIGQTVFTAQNAIEGLEMALRHQPDIVISDIGMPTIDGYQLAAMFRAQPQLRRVRLVALTGYGQEIDRINALAAGFDDHLVKPVSVETLRTLLAQLNHEN